MQSGQGAGMRRDQIIEKLKEHEGAIRALGAESLYLYGSCARDEAGPDSDVDVFLERTQDGKLGLLELAQIKRILEGALKSDVDVGTRRGLHPILRSAIEADAIQVF
jgi:uncharacterized protein